MSEKNIEKLLIQRKQLLDEMSELDQQIEYVNIHTKNKEIRKNYIQVVCPNCFGTGMVNGHGIYPDINCPNCEGKGFLYARKFEEKWEYNLEYSEI